MIIIAFHLELYVAPKACLFYNYATLLSVHRVKNKLFPVSQNVARPVMRTFPNKDFLHHKCKLSLRKNRKNIVHRQRKSSEHVSINAMSLVHHSQSDNSDVQIRQFIVYNYIMINVCHHLIVSHIF